MKRLSEIGFGILLLALVAVPSSLRADSILLNDGTTREGKILSRSSTSVQIRVDEGGMQATIDIPTANINKITLGNTAPPAPAPPPATTPTVISAPPEKPVATAPSPSLVHVTPISPPPTTSPAVNTPSAVPASHPGAVSQLPQSRGFMIELGYGMLGMGPGNVNRLPSDLKALWDNAITLDAAGKKSAELDALRALEQAFGASPDGLDRLDGITKRERGTPFATWMANIHWDVLSMNYGNGIFDLRDVRDVERPVLIGLLKEKTQPALDALKSYFPPLDPKTDKPVPFRPAQLSGISADNALDIKDKALLAHALVLGQIKLEPDMPAPDKVLLYTQLATINHVISRTNELEPQARAKQLQADRKAKAAASH